MCFVVYPHNLQRSLKETPWESCGFLLTLPCELMGCWGKTSIGRENMRAALHKSSLLIVYDIGLEWPNIVLWPLPPKTYRGFETLFTPWGPCHCNFLLSVVLRINHEHQRQLQVLLPSFDLNFCQLHFPNLHTDLARDCDELYRTD